MPSFCMANCEQKFSCFEHQQHCLSVWTNSQSTPTDSLVHCSCSIYNSRHSLKIRQRPTCDKEGSIHKCLKSAISCFVDIADKLCDVGVMPYSNSSGCIPENRIELFCSAQFETCNVESKPYKAQSKKKIEWTSLQSLDSKQFSVALLSQR